MTHNGSYSRLSFFKHNRRAANKQGGKATGQVLRFFPLCGTLIGTFCISKPDRRENQLRVKSHRPHSIHLRLKHSPPQGPHIFLTQILPPRILGTLKHKGTEHSDCFTTSRRVKSDAPVRTEHSHAATRAHEMETGHKGHSPVLLIGDFIPFSFSLTEYARLRNTPPLLGFGVSEMEKKHN